MKAPTPQTLRHHSGPFAISPPNMLRQRELHPGAREGAGQGGVQAGSTGPGQLDPVASGSQEAAQAGVPDVSPEPHRACSTALGCPPRGCRHLGCQPWGQGGQAAPQEAPSWARPRRGEAGWGGLLGERRRGTRAGDQPSLPPLPPAFSASWVAPLTPGSPTGDTPVPRDPDQPQLQAGPSETCRDSLLPKPSPGTPRWTSEPR